MPCLSGYENPYPINWGCLVLAKAWRSPGARQSAPLASVECRGTIDTQGCIYFLRVLRIPHTLMRLIMAAETRALSGFDGAWVFFLYVFVNVICLLSHLDADGLKRIVPVGDNVKEKTPFMKNRNRESSSPCVKQYPIFP